MKFLILSLQLFIGSTLFANSTGPDKPEHPDMHSFYLSFPAAKEIQWEIQNNMVLITFLNEGHTLYAYYSMDGEQLAVSRIIRASELPINTAANLNRKLQNKWLVNVFEISINNETSYYATVRDSNTQLLLKTGGFGEWVVFKKSRINQ